MDKRIDVQCKQELLSRLCTKYPRYKPQVIRKMINKFDCDSTKIESLLRQGSVCESPNNFSDLVTSNSSEPEKRSVYSFVSINSVNSGSNSPVFGQKNYRSSNEIFKITTQKIDLQKLDDAFKRLEKHRDYLNRETLFFGEVIERRKSEIDFPNIIEIELLDKLVNKTYSMPVKSLSYANDLRHPLEMNRRFAGFNSPYSGRDNGATSKKVSKYLKRDQMNPNLVHSSEKIDPNHSQLVKPDEKRHSGHFETDRNFPLEFSDRRHRRQKSDPWQVERYRVWECPQCYISNSSLNCSFCEYDPNSKP